MDSDPTTQVTGEAPLSRDGGVDANQGWAQTEPRGAYGANAGKGGKVAQASGDRSNKFLPCLPEQQHMVERHVVPSSGLPYSPPPGELDGLDDSLDAEDTFSDTDEDDEDTPWIQWFTNIKGNEFFCQVDEEYVQDDFNLTGLSSYVPYYENALDVILDMESPDDQQLTEEQQEVVESAAEMLYGLIHARFILTSRGLPAMLDKYRKVDFGRCPHVFCQGQPVLPLGLSDVLGNSMVKIWCPKCQDVYFPKSSRTCSIDGAYFGTTFAHLFMLQHHDLVPPPPSQTYVPKIYGFRINPAAKCIQVRNDLAQQQTIKHQDQVRTRRDQRQELKESKMRDSKLAAAEKGEVKAEETTEERASGKAVDGRTDS